MTALFQAIVFYIVLIIIFALIGGATRGMDGLNIGTTFGLFLSNVLFCHYRDQLIK